MNIRSLINFNQVMNTIIGIDVRMTRPDSSGMEFFYCVLNQNKTKLSVIELGSASDLENLHSRISKWLGARVHVNFSGVSILIKHIEKKHVKHDEVLSLAFPFLNPSDVLTQSYGLPDGSSFITVLRKEQTSIIDVLSSQNHALCSVSLGPFICGSITALLNNEVLECAGYRIDLKEGFIKSVTDSPIAENETQTINVGGNQLLSEFVVPFAGAYGMLTETKALQTTPDFRMGANQFADKKILHRVGRITLVVTLALLMTNASIFFWLSDKVESLEADIQVEQNVSKKHLERANKNSDLKTAYDQLGWNSNSLPLAYADGLAETLPDNIQLTSLEIGTQDHTATRQQKRMIFNADKIIIKGNAENPVVLAEWIQRVKDLDWVEKLSDQQYALDKRSNKGLFELSLNLK